MSDKLKSNNESVQRTELHRKIWAIAEITDEDSRYF